MSRPLKLNTALNPSTNRQKYENFWDRGSNVLGCDSEIVRMLSVCPLSISRLDACSKGQPGHHGRERGGRWADLSSPFAIANARAGGTETVAACGALALRILALAMSNARSIRIVNSLT